MVGRTGDTATTQLAELNSALGAYGISASLDTTGKLAFSSSGAYSVTVGTVDRRPAVITASTPR